MKPRSEYHELSLDIRRQPSAVSCGPTCLHAVYRYHGDEIALDAVIEEVPTLSDGGTLAVSLANHALRRGYGAQIFTYNLSVFDPTWFGADVDIAERLRAQVRAKRDPKLAEATRAYLEFLELGGRLGFEDLTDGLLTRALVRERPILTGLSATFLYRCAREVGSHEPMEDDVRGAPTGHFVVLCGWDPESGRVRVADPYEEGPDTAGAESGNRLYWVPVQRLLNAILLGVLTYDANLLVLEPPLEDPK